MTTPEVVSAKPLPRRVRIDLRIRHFVWVVVLALCIFNLLYGFAEVFLWGGLVNTFIHFVVGVMFAYLAAREAQTIHRIRKQYR